MILKVLRITFFQSIVSRHEGVFAMLCTVPTWFCDGSLRNARGGFSAFFVAVTKFGAGFAYARR